MSDPRTDAEAALRAGDPRAALQHLTSAVRAKPADAKLRIFMAQLLCVLGQWERAHTQLNVVADMDAETVAMRETVGHAIRCELIRAKVFAGNRTPMVFGAPDEWLALLIESLLQKGQGNAAMGDELAARAFDAAPEVKGKIDGESFSWLADGDSRLGPVLEACVNGRYYWVPLSRLSRVEIDPPADLRDCVWMAATLMFSNGGETVALIPTRYPRLRIERGRRDLPGSQDRVDRCRKRTLVRTRPARFLDRRRRARDHGGSYDRARRRARRARAGRRVGLISGSRWPA